MEQCVVFCRTNVDCMNLESFLRSLREAGTSSHLSCSVLAGRLSQDQRKASLDLFKQGTVDILICTDVGARGLDISGIPFVVNMTLPDERSVEDYIHRVGRVGRAGRMGLAISLVAADNVLEKVWYHTCSNPLKCSNRGVKGGAATDGRGGGGCCIWYDESQVLQRVEKRLQQKIATMLPGSDFALPEEIAGKKVSYGVDVIASESSSLLLSYSGEHLQALSAVVKDLAEMETEAQNVFLKMSLFNTRTNNRNSGNNAVLS